MSKGSRPATCSVSSKRLRAKTWYYRDGKYFYNKRAWLDEKAKQAKEAVKAAPAAEQPAAAPPESSSAKE